MPSFRGDVETCGNRYSPVGGETGCSFAFGGVRMKKMNLLAGFGVLRQNGTPDHVPFG